MKTVQTRASHEQGIALLGVMILALVLALLGAALLDLAGLGYSGRDITKAMVEKYASL